MSNFVKAYISEMASVIYFISLDIPTPVQRISLVLFGQQIMEL